jgi:3-deoxy-manno-octulosonate cytidylyltransferase (CMP-KDO synthetase)
MSEVVGVIPARLASTRLPRKLLLAETGKTILQHTWERARLARRLSRLVIAADSDEIAAAVRDFGGDCELTGDHPSGTDRIAEVVARRFPECGIVVNIQGDEPEIEPAHIDVAVDVLASNPGADMSTLCRIIRRFEEWESPSCVKVVTAADGRALYFSRCPIPFVRDAEPDELLTGDSPWRLHVGLYAYRGPFLQRLAKLAPSRLERLEKLEQLRALEAGARIQVAEVEHPAVGIDTPDDYSRFVQRWRTRNKSSSASE